MDEINLRYKMQRDVLFRKRSILGRRISRNLWPERPWLVPDLLEQELPIFSCTPRTSARLWIPGTPCADTPPSKVARIRYPCCSRRRTPASVPESRDSSKNWTLMSNSSRKPKVTLWRRTGFQGRPSWLFVLTAAMV